jgi:hypothetical protein
MISARILEADEVQDLQEQLKIFFSSNPNLERKDIIKIDFISVVVIDEFGLDRVEHRAFIVYEERELEDIINA